MTTRVALVTGGTGGIGTAICQELARQGHKVATNYRDEAKTKAWQDAQRAAGFDFTIAKGDVADTAGAEKMVREIEAKLGPVDILINNAGITRDTTFHKMTAVQWQEVINTNLNSCFNVTRPVIDAALTTPAPAMSKTTAARNGKKARQAGTIWKRDEDIGNSFRRLARRGMDAPDDQVS